MKAQSLSALLLLGLIQSYAGAAVQGFVVMQDIGGAVSQASLSAEFTGSRSLKLSNQEFNLSLDRLTSSVDAASCNMQTSPKTGTTTPANTNVDMGKLFFRPASTQSLTELSQSAEHVYSYKIDPAFSTGLYEFTGGVGANAFKDLLSVPEMVTNGKAGGQVIGKNMLTITKAQDLKLEWDSSALIDSTTRVMLEIITETDTDNVTLVCLAAEKNLGTSKTMTWEIPKNFLAQLPTNANAILALIRANVVGGAHGTVKNTLLGMRAVVALSSLE